MSTDRQSSMVQSPLDTADDSGQAVYNVPPVSRTVHGEGYTMSAQSTSSPWTAAPDSSSGQASPSQPALGDTEAYITQLEEQNEAYRMKIQSLERRIGEIGIAPAALHVAPSPILKRPLDQGQRTAIRLNLLATLNHHGNRCCSWHETRRELHQYGPREAPTGTMNCGCTFEQALFEESLAKAGIGSMETGPTRLSSTLRNALLQVFQRAYDYIDGDLAFNRDTSQWFSGESPADWSEKEFFYES